MDDLPISSADPWAGTSVFDVATCWDETGGEGEEEKIDCKVEMLACAVVTNKAVADTLRLEADDVDVTASPSRPAGVGVTSGPSHRSRYSDTNTRRMRFRLSMVLTSRLTFVSDSLCHTRGKGEEIR